MRKGKARWAAACTAMLLAAAPVGAQDGPAGLAAACASGGGEALEARCGDAALAAHALTGGLGLLAAAGGAFPVAPSTAGHRLEGSPRIVVDVGGAYGSFHLPDPTRGDGGAVDHRARFVSGRVTLAGGVFDGFSPAATIGGVGSVDGILSLRILRLPSGDGFTGSTAAFGAGARIGLVRESFSVPGVTVTAMHHRLGTVRYGNAAAHGFRAIVEPRVNSARVEVGKELLAIGFSGGLGWQRASADARIRAQAGEAEGDAGPVPLRDSRRVYFAGLNYTWLVTQVAAELTWAPGVSGSPDLQGSGPFEPGRGSLQATLGLRLMY